MVIGGSVAVLFFIRRVGSDVLKRAGRRTLFRHRARVNRYTMTRKSFVIAQVLADPAVADAVHAHVAEHNVEERATWQQVHKYLDEIVPFFNVLAYYRLGYNISRFVLGLFYKVTVEYERPDPFRGVPRNSMVIYLMNHRSNADYVLVAYVMMGQVSISYAVGEWARAFPLEHIFKSFGSYFIRRRYREPLYHAVLQAYVQLITRNAVTQGIFPEGGLSRDGALRPAKIGLLDYALGVARDAESRAKMYIVPVGINYDRVLEDRSLLRELEVQAQRPVSGKWSQVGDVMHYLFWNATRMLTGQWRRYGRAAVTIGAPIAIDTWLTQRESEGVDVFALSREQRLPHVQQFCDSVLTRIGAIIPVTPVPLACAALQSFDADFVSHHALLERMEAMRDVLQEFNGRVVRADRDIADTFDRAYRMLRMRRMIARSGESYVVLPKGRALINYYANSIVHLLGPFAEAVRERDRLPISAHLPG